MPLVLETKIPLPNVAGRIDHLAVDLGRERLFVVTSGANLAKSHRIEFPGSVAIACSPDPIKRAAVLGPIKAEPFGWPRKARPALTSRARGSVL